MRALLLASATVASRAGRRPSTPAALSHCPARKAIDVAPRTSEVRTVLLPALVMRPNHALPPVECWRGTKPSQAAKCRALLNKPMLATVAAIKERST